MAESGKNSEKRSAAKKAAPMFSDHELLAYINGETPQGDRIRIYSALAKDKALKDRLDALQKAGASETQTKPATPKQPTPKKTENKKPAPKPEKKPAAREDAQQADTAKAKPPEAAAAKDDAAKPKSPQAKATQTGTIAAATATAPAPDSPPPAAARDGSMQWWMFVLMLVAATITGVVIYDVVRDARKPAQPTLAEAAPVEAAPAAEAVDAAPTLRDGPANTDTTQATTATQSESVEAAGEDAALTIPAPPALPSLPEAGDGDWRVAAAEHMRRLTVEDATPVKTDADILALQLRELGSHLGLPLGPKRAAIPGLDLLAAGMMNRDDRPMGRLVYRDARGQILTLYMLRETDDERRPNRNIANETIGGVAAIHWTRGPYGYVVFGEQGGRALTAPAIEMAWRL